MKKTILAAVILSAFVCVPAFAAQYDSFDRDPDDVLVSDALRPEIAAVFSEKLDLQGTPCLVPRSPAEILRRLNSLIEAHPEETGLLYERGRVQYSLAHFDEAEKDFTAFADKHPDRVFALSALADFYGDRLRPKERVTALMRLFIELTGKNDRKKGDLVNVINEALATGRNNLIEVDGPGLWKRLLALYPDDWEAAMGFLRSRSGGSDRDALISEALEFSRRYPGHEAPFLEFAAGLYMADHRLEDALKVYESRLTVDSPAVLFQSLCQFLSEQGQSAQYLQRVLASPPDPQGLRNALIIHLKIFDYRESEARAQLQKWIDEVPEPKPADLARFAEYARRCDEYGLAARLLYRGLPAIEGADRGKWLSQLFHALMDADRAAFAPAYSVSDAFRELIHDPGPGFGGGMTSLLLSGDYLDTTFDEIARAYGRQQNLRRAIKVRDVYAREFPTGSELPEMDVAVIERFAKLSAWEEVIARADIMAGARPQDPMLIDALRLKARALFELERVDDAKAAYDAVLELARAKGEDQFLSDLDDYARWLMRKKKYDAAVALYWREIEARPRDGKVYEKFLDLVSSMNLEDDKLKLLELAVKNLPGSSWPSRLARLYFSRGMGVMYSQTLNEAVASLPPGEIDDFIGQAVSGWDERAMALKASLYLAAHKRHPRRSEYAASYFSFIKRSGFGRSAPCADAGCHEPTVDMARSVLLDDHRLGGEASRILLSSLARSGLLSKAVSEIIAKPGRNRAEEYFLALALDFESRYEESAAPWKALSDRYGATPFFAVTLSDRLLGLAKTRPERFPSARKEAEEALFRMESLYPVESVYPTRMGEALIGSGKLSEAVASWKKIPGQAPGSSSRVLEAALLCWDYFQYQDAVAIITAGRERMKDPSLHAFQLGVIYEDMGDIESAVREYVRGAIGSGGSDDASRLVSLARGKNLFDMVDSTFIDEENAMPLDTAPVRAHAEFLLAAENFDALDRTLTDAAKRIDDREFLFWAAGTLGGRGRTSAALAVWERLAELNPRDLEVMTGLLEFLGRTNQDLEMEKRAREMRHKIVSLPADEQSAWLSALGDELWRAGKNELALEALRSAAAEAKGDDYKRLTLDLAGKLHQAGADGEAASVIEAALTREGFDPDLFSSLTRAYAWEKNYRGIIEAHRAMKKWIDQNAKAQVRRDLLSGLHRDSARGLALCERPMEAADYYIEWINLKPSDLSRLGEAYSAAARGRVTQRLIDYYARTAEEAHKDYRWSMTLARLLAWDRRGSEAIDAYRAAIRNEPRVEELYEEMIPLLAGAKDFDGAAQARHQLAVVRGGSRADFRDAGRLFLMAGETVKAGDALKKGLDNGFSSRFAAAESCMSAGRPEIALPLLDEGLELFLTVAREQSIDSSSIGLLIDGHAQAGKLGGVFTLLLDARQSLLNLEKKPENRYDAWRLAASREAVEGAMVSALPKAVIEYGAAADLSAARDWLKKEKGKGTSPYLLYRMAVAMGFTDEAVAMLSAARTETSATQSPPPVPKDSDFWRVRLDFARVAKVQGLPVGDSINALAWIGSRDKLIAALTANYGTSSTLIARDRVLLDLLMQKGGEKGLNQILSDSKMIPPEADFLVERGRFDLAEKTLRHADRQAWAVFKVLLVKLAARDFKPEFADEADKTLRLMNIGDRLAQPVDEATQLTGHEQAVALAKYAEWLAAAGRGGQAEPLWAAPAEDAPTNSQAYRFTGQALAAAGLDSEASEFFERARMLSPKDPPTLYALARIKLKQGDTAAALALFNAMAGNTAEAGMNTSGKFYQFQSMLAAGLDEEAVKRLSAWIESGYRESDNAETLRSHARSGMESLANYSCLSNPGEPPDGFRDFVLALLRKNPDDSLLARSALDNGWVGPKRADEIFDLVIEAKKKAGEPSAAHQWTIDKVDYFLSRGMFDQAQAGVLELELPLSPEDISEDDIRRVILVRCGRSMEEEASQAAESWLAGRDFAPEWLTLIKDVAVDAGVHGRKIAERAFSRLLDDPEAPSELHLEYADFLLEAGREQDAMDAIHRLISLRPADAGTLALCAAALEKHGRYNEAAALRKDALVFAPLDHASRLAFARDLYLAGKADTAIGQAAMFLVSPLAPRSEKDAMVRSLIGLINDSGDRGEAGKFGEIIEDKAGEGEYPAALLTGAAAFFLAAEQNKDAVEAAEKAYGLDPTRSAEVYALVLLETGEAKKAAAVVAGALAARPGNSSLTRLFALAQLDAGEPDRAIAAALLDADLIRAMDPSLDLDFSGNGDYYSSQESQTLSSLLGADMPLELKVRLVRGMAKRLEERKLYFAARGLIMALVRYFDPSRVDIDGSCVWSAQPAEIPAVKLTDGARALLDELSAGLDRLEGLEREARAAKDQRLRIIPRLDNGIEWSWLSPQLASPWEEFVKKVSAGKGGKP